MIVTQSINSKVTIPPLHNEQYIKLEPNADGIIESQIFPGLYLNKAALLSGDLAQVLATLQIGFATPEHQSFID